MIDHSQEIGELAAALAAVQFEVQDVYRDTDGQIGTQRYRYADLGSVLAVVRPLLAKNGLAISQHPTDAEAGRVGLSTILTHRSGQWIASSYSMPVDEHRGLSAPQCAGLVISYMRRYAVAAVVGITQTDDDASAEVRDPLEAKREEIWRRAKALWPSPRPGLLALCEARGLPSSSSAMSAEQLDELVAALANEKQIGGDK